MYKVVEQSSLAAQITGKEFNKTGACTIKLFTDVIYGFLSKARVFVLGKPFQPSLMFAGEARSIPIVEHLKGPSLG